MQALSTQALLKGGFERACCWIVEDEALRLSGHLLNEPGVYAFAVDGIVQYVGVATRGLAKRLYFYSRPGPTQKTNIRLNAVLLATLRGGKEVEVFVAVPPDLSWNGWLMSGPEALESGIIRTFELPWNVRGVSSTSSIQREPIRATPKLEDSHVTPARAGPSGDKYRPLREHLSRCGQEKVSMTFAQIQELVGPLPKSASLHRAWWANHEGNTQAKGWMPARYLAEPNPAHRSVVFRRFSY